MRTFAPMTFLVITVLAVCLIAGVAILRRALSDRNRNSGEECGRCGQRNPRLAKFCARCGTKLV